MTISKRRARQLLLSTALWSSAVTSAAADPPAQADPGQGAAPKPVRQVGGAQGTQVEAKPAPSAAGQTPAQRAELRERMRAAHEAMLRAREQIRAHAVPGKPMDHEAASEAREDAREAVQEARLQLHEARTQMQLTAEQAGAGDRHERAKRARHLAWRALALRIKRPSDIPAELRSEYRQHARRMARLQRIRRLAAEKQDKPVLDRVAKLTAREQARHHDLLATYFQAHPPLQPAPAAPAARAAAPADENENEIEPEELEEQENEERGEP